ncbi:hypothetical protein K439DRAFT_142344 [Ramaria rubella]|nr:hypothetical protein K439DRAFT_142344 [Ramaria rubella]
MGKNTLSKDVNNATSFKVQIGIICERLRIPDLGTRSGLRKVHRSFPEVYQRLSTCYRENSQHHAVQGAIITIYARMCADSLLRDKLFNKGFLSQILPLLDMPQYRVSALQCLVMITHHGGREARHALAALTPKLVKFAEDDISNPLITEPCIVVAAHSVTSVLCPDTDKPDPKLLNSIGPLDSLLKLIDTLFHHPATTHQTLSHALGLLSAAPMHGRDAFLAHPSSISFLVSCLRSKDVQTRVVALSGLLRLQHSVCESEAPKLDHHKLLANLEKRKPSSLEDTLVRYGPERAEITAYLTTSLDYQKAMMKCAQDHDMYSLGMKIFELIGRTEYSVADGMFQDQDGKIISDLGLPFVRWLDALPHCVKAIRDRGIPAQRDAANIVELKYLILKTRIKEAYPLALEAIRSSPNVGFYYYVLTMGSETHADGLRWAKKGMKCTGPSMTPYVRFGLLFNALESAGLLGLVTLEQSHEGEKAWVEGYTFLKCALEDSKTYIAQAPPDSRHMSSAIMWCTLLSIALRGPDLSLDLREIQSLFDKQKVADEMKAFIHSAPIAKTGFRLAREDILRYYASASVEWASVISRFENPPSETTSQALIVSRSPAEELAEWLNGTSLDDESEEPRKYCVQSNVDQDGLELWKCSHCGNPSAMLKKCTRCAKARYCDASCQRAHWSEHKKVCKSPTTA